MKSKTKVSDNIYFFVLFLMTFALPIYFFSLKDYGIPTPVRLTGLLVIGFTPILFSMAFAGITEMVLRKWKECDTEKGEIKIHLLYALVFLIISFPGISYAESVQGWEATLETFSNLMLVGLGLFILISVLNKRIFK